MGFSFLHMADVHLGSPFRGLRVREPEVAARFAQATRDAFTNLVDLAVERRVAFVVVAGDLYDREWQDNQLGLFFNREAARLDRAGIPLFLLRGNHDAESVVTRAIALPGSVRTFPSKVARTERLEALGVAIHGQSFANAAVPDNLAKDYPPAVPGAFNVGILHTSLTGREGHDAYAPCSLDDLRAKGYDYWALGHIHKPEVVSADPHVVYPGNVQGRSVRETGARGAVVVHVEGGRVERLETVTADVARWAVVDIEIAAGDEMGDVHAKVSEAIGREIAAAEGRLLAFRVRLVGETPLHERLVFDRAELRDEFEAAAQRLTEDAWLEKVVVATRPAKAATPLDLAGFALDPAMALAVADDVFAQRIAGDLADLAAKLPGETFDADAILEEAKLLARAKVEGGASD